MYTQHSSRGHSLESEESTPLLQLPIFNIAAENRWAIKVKATIAMVTVAFMVAASGVFLQLLERKIPDLEINAARYLAALITVLVTMVVYRDKPIIARQHLSATLAVLVCWITGSLSTFVSISMLSAASQQSIYMSTAVIGGLLVFWITVRERPTCIKVLSAVISILGVMLVLQPDFIFNGSKDGVNVDPNHQIKCPEQNASHSDWRMINRTTFNYVEESLEGKNKSLLENCTFLPGIENGNNLTISMESFAKILTIFGGLIWIADTVIIKRNPHLFEIGNLSPILFWLYLAGFTISAVASAIFEDFTLPDTLNAWIYSLGHCLAYCFVMPGLVYATTYLDGSTVMILCSSSTVFMVVAQYTFMKDIMPGNQNWIEVMGVGLVLLSSILSSLIEIISSKLKRVGC